jgi:TetR/AcrR family transcriptional repressor of nem operon
MSGDRKLEKTILAADRRTAQAHGYGGLSFRDLAAEVRIKSASIYHYFPSKADLGAAVARLYREDSVAALALLVDAPNPADALRISRYVSQGADMKTAYARAVVMAAEYDDLRFP